ncbi:hypothetical protein SUGI_0220240 [Cryptomeria japonica]|nr:hypothetical protein SUGI_0220240 [Cryptomeria japonica]
MPKDQSPNLSTVLGHINIEKTSCASGRVEEVRATTAKFEDCQSGSSDCVADISNLCLPVEDQKAFGSPLSVDGIK